MTSITRLAAALLLLFCSRQSHALLAQSSLAGETLRITRTTGSIKIDGDLSDEGWQRVTPVTTWYEVNPGDNTPPKVRNVGRIAYDDRISLRRVRVRRSESARDSRAVFGSRRLRRRVLRLRRNLRRRGQQRSHRQAVRRHAAQHPGRFDHRRCVGRGHVAGFLLGIGDEDQRARLDARDADPVHVASLQEQRSADVGHPAVPELSARSQLPVPLGEDAARVQLLRLPRQYARGLAAAADGRSPGRRSVRQLQLGRPSRGRSRIAARRPIRCSSTSAST